MIRKSFLLSFAFLAIFNCVRAQHFTGVATSDWSIANSMYLNPANIAGSHERLVINIFSLNLYVDNNLGTFNKLSNLFKSANGSTDIFKLGHSNEPFNIIVPSLEIRGPGAIYSLNDEHRQTFALTTRV